MPRVALDSETGQKVLIRDWVMHYMEKTPLCLVCNEEMYTRGNSSPGVTTHFSHYTGTKCPIVGGRRKLYDNLQPIEKDMENTKKYKVFY